MLAPPGEVQHLRADRWRPRDLTRTRTRVMAFPACDGGDGGGDGACPLPQVDGYWGEALPELLARFADPVGSSVQVCRSSATLVR